MNTKLPAIEVYYTLEEALSALHGQVAIVSGDADPPPVEIRVNGLVVDGKTWKNPIFAIQDDGVVATVRFARVITQAWTDLHDQTNEALEQAISGYNRAGLLMDFGEVNTLGSAGISGLIRIWRDFSVRGRRLAFCRVRPAILELFHICRLPLTFPVA